MEAEKFIRDCDVVFIVRRRRFSPPRQRPVRPDFPDRGERGPYPGPAKRPKFEPRIPYAGPTRPYFKPATRLAEPRMSNHPVMIEKRPVLFNAPPKTVTAFPPLPQRLKPALKPQPKPAPQTQPIKPAEKPPISPQKQVPVKTVQKPTPVLPVEKQMPIKPVQNQMPVKPAQKQMPVKPAQKQMPVKPVQKQMPVIPVENQAPVKPIQKQMPVIPVEKQAPVKPIQKQMPAKPVEKQVPKPVQKEPIKPVLQVPDTQAAAEKVPEPVEEIVEVTTDGESLTSLASRVLAEEIQAVMDQIAEELPEKEQENEAVKLVVGRFKTVISDDIRNALGLNVTKRLLNLHDPLYVKLLFSGKPEAGCLQAFIARYNIGAFKRIPAPGDTFAARLDALRDFDRLCAEPELRCGSAKVTVTPCYKFLTCPSKVKSIYAVKNEETSEEKTENLNISSSDETQAQKENTADEDDNAKDDKNIIVKEEVIKIKEEVRGTLEETNPEIKIEVTDTVVQTRPVTPVKNTKPAAMTPVKVNITIEAATKLDVSKDVSKEIKMEFEDEILEEIENEISTKVKSESNIDDKSSKQAKNSGVDDKSDDVEDKDEEISEMTDHDIQALMSGGIVLDECSGSEDEK